MPQARRRATLLRSEPGIQRIAHGVAKDVGREHQSEHEDEGRQLRRLRAYKRFGSQVATNTTSALLVPGAGSAAAAAPTLPHG
jgi:hypothetical protein